MNDGKAEVTAHAPGGRGEISDLATYIKDATGAACVALVTARATFSGTSGIGSWTSSEPVTV